MVNMCVYSKQSLEDVLNYWKEILWIACVFITWEIFLVVNIFLSPHHYVCNIFVCWKHDWLLGFSICPEIFKLRSCCHLWAMTLCWDWCKQCAKLIIEIDNSNAKPIFKNFTCGRRTASWTLPAPIVALYVWVSLNVLWFELNVTGRNVGVGPFILGIRI